MMNQEAFDLLVLGSGAAGEKGAAQAAYFGKSVGLVEPEPSLGGATAGTTVPSKTLRETAVALSGLKARKLHGVDLSLRRQATVKDFLRHEQTVKGAEQTRVLNNMERHNVKIFSGMGSFVDNRTIRVDRTGEAPVYLEAKVILIATGSSPRRPDGIPDDPRIYDSDTVLTMQGMPKTLTVLGGGVIGCEYACTFSALGVDVTLVNAVETLLPFLDPAISNALKPAMERIGVRMQMPEMFNTCTALKNGIKISMESGLELTSDALMLATGRNSNTAALNLDAAGITPGKFARLETDKNYQVVHPETRKPVSGIYAVGDVIGAPALASTSMEQARYAMIKAFNLAPYKSHVAPILPMGIYTIPECFGAGLNEIECKEQGIEYVTGNAHCEHNARGMIIGDDDGFLKLIYEYDPDIEKPMVLLGVHMIGEIASEIGHLGLLALLSKATSDLFINACFNYPTLGELYKYATYDAMGARARRSTG